MAALEKFKGAIIQNAFVFIKLKGREAFFSSMDITVGTYIFNLEKCRFRKSKNREKGIIRSTKTAHKTITYRQSKKPRSDTMVMGKTASAMG